MGRESISQRKLPTPGVRSIVSKPVTQTPGGGVLEINVVYTTVPGTTAALKAAQDLARNLEAQTNLLVPQVVPLQFPLSSPPVSIAFIERRAHAMAMECSQEANINVQVYLCGDKLKCLLKVLRPQSLVLVGGKKRWWHTAEEKLAKVLLSKGHRVIFVYGD